MDSLCPPESLQERTKRNPLAVSSSEKNLSFLSVFHRSVHQLCKAEAVPSTGLAPGPDSAFRAASRHKLSVVTMMAGAQFKVWRQPSQRGKTFSCSQSRLRGWG